MAKSKEAHDYVPPIKQSVALAVRAFAEGTATQEQQGEVFRWLMVDVCNAKNPSYRAGRADDTAFLEGRRFVGLFLAAAMTKNANAKGEE